MSPQNSLCSLLPRPSPLGTVCSLWVCFCFVNKLVCIMSFQILHIRDIIQHFSFSVWLTSLTVTISRLIHVAVNGVISFFSLWLSNISLGFPAYNAGDSGDVASVPGWEGPLEEGTATHSSLLAWENRWTVEPGGLQSMGRQRAEHDWSAWARTQKQGNVMSMIKWILWEPSAQIILNGGKWQRRR